MKGASGTMSNDTTRTIQNILKRMFFAFSDICERNNLRYYLIDGSLLGAIRHKGFIPWDDDMDIAMPRPDYEKFCQIAKEELPSNMYFVSYEESLKGQYFGEIAHLFCKDMKIETSYFDRDITTDVWLDIMIMYGMPDNAYKRKVHYKRYYLCKGVARLGRIKNVGDRKYSKIEKMALFIARKIDLSKLFNTEKLLLRSVSILKKYPFDKSNYVVVVPSEYGDREIMPKEYYTKERHGEFEGKTILIAGEAEKILTSLYGDYMELPPVEKRTSKHKVRILT